MGKLVNDLFYSGNYLSLLKATVDSKSGTFQRRDAVPVIGALAFRGRMEEARRLFDRQSSELIPAEVVEARFYLGVGFCRHSEYATARHFFALNLRERVGAKNFFTHQGIGFYRYFCGRYIQALRSARLARDAALSANFLYGKAMAADLMGFCLVETGEIHAGLAKLEDALGYARLLGNGSLAQSFQISIATYRAQFGLDPKNTLTELRKLSSILDPQDTYSRAGLLLELARQLTLRGQCREAKATLDEVCHFTYAHEHRRFCVILNIRYAYLWHLAGDNYQALNLVRNAIRQLDTNVDLGLELEGRGLERSITHALGIVSDTSRLVYLTRRTGKMTGRRYLARGEGRSGWQTSIGQDPLGDLKDAIRSSLDDVLEEIVDLEFFALLFDVPGIRSEEMALHFDLIPNHVVLVDRGNVKLLGKGVTAITRSLAGVLATGRTTKETLIRSIWRYDYSPLRHDVLVYGAIARFRQLLGEYSCWLQGDGGIYEFTPTVRVHMHGEPPPPRTASVPVISSEVLTYRQRQILKVLQKRDFVDVETCRSLFDVCDMTVRRDLAAMTRASVLDRIGKGRAIKYILKEM